MKTVAVICEYNPFHRGHCKQISRIREEVGECRILSVMSGNFVQRGGPALFEKYDRAALAVDGGSDLVVELPYPWSGAPADRFAAAGVRIASALGADILAFGAESREEDLRAAAAFCYRKPEAAHDPRSFARAREDAFFSATGRTFPGGANDRLAIEYLRVAGSGAFPDGVLVLPREDDGFSAHRARAAVLSNDSALLFDLLPSPERISGLPTATIEKGTPLILARLRTADAEEISRLFDIPAEMAVRLLRAAKDCATDDYAALWRRLSDKNDSSARIRRGIITALLKPMPEDLARLPYSTTLLGASERGKTLLREQRDMENSFRVYTKRADIPDGRQKTLELRADLLWGLFAGKVESETGILSRKPYLCGK